MTKTDLYKYGLTDRIARAAAGYEGLRLARVAAQYKDMYRVVAAGADYLQVRMTAGDGPMGTRDYQIVFEAVPLDEGIHDIADATASDHERDQHIRLLQDFIRRQAPLDRLGSHPSFFRASIIMVEPARQAASSSVNGSAIATRPK